MFYSHSPIFFLLTKFVDGVGDGGGGDVCCFFKLKISFHVCKGTKISQRQSSQANPGIQARVINP